MMKVVMGIMELNNGATLTTDRFGNANSAYGFVVDGSVGWGVLNNI